MIWLMLVVLFLFIGFAMQKLKWYFLISGYNTMTKEQKENVNVKALGKLLAIYSYSLAGLFALIALVDWLDYSQFIMPLLILFIILTVFVVVKSQKYNHNIFDENGKWKKGASKQLKKPTIILAITFIGVAIIMYFSLQPTGIETTEEGIEIAGMYGDSYAWSEMEQVTLLEELPKVAMRTNGSAIGSKLKGHFKFENGEKAKLFVDKSIPPFISFVSQGNTIIFNLETEQETIELYEQLRNKTTK